MHASSVCKHYISRQKLHPSTVLCDKYFDVLNHLGKTRSATDGQTDRHFDSKGCTSLHCVARSRDQQRMNTDDRHKAKNITSHIRVDIYM